MKDNVQNITWSQLVKLISIAITVGTIIFWGGTVYNKVNYVAENIDKALETGRENKTDIALIKLFVGFDN